MVKEKEAKVKYVRNTIDLLRTIQLKYHLIGIRHKKVGPRLD
jgi:hypothetical protein